MAIQGQVMTAQAQLSARNTETMTHDMSEMTHDMNRVAKKTKLETISMRIVTLVTLLFLPGTFISVGGPVSRRTAPENQANSVQTLMSTDIIRFQVDDQHHSTRVYQWRALQTYLAISLPLVLVTCV